LNNKALDNSYHSAYIGLGSNLQNPNQQIHNALNALGQLTKCQKMRSSRWYGSKAIGPGEQPDYINAAVYLETQLSAIELLHELQDIEDTHGRQRHIRWGARTLDLDLLLYDKLHINTQELQLPHPEILNRNFVLYPLYDLSPELIFPNGQALTKVLSTITMDGLYHIEPIMTGKNTQHEC
jgi:2-amino-4-hydroxy-6-hydroxymethyldihydropteridine diphosphokinase